MQDFFRKFSARVSTAVGRPVAFLGAFIIVLIWITSGPAFGFSDTWQLVINTGTTIVTFLVVFLIQNTQNRNSKAMQLKLDELLRSQKGARTSLVELEDLNDEELAALIEEFKKIHDRYSTKLSATLQEQIIAEKERRHHGHILGNFGAAKNHVANAGHNTPPPTANNNGSHATE